jgi:hypothetical protein
VTIAAIERGTPSLIEAREIIAAFRAMIRKKLAGTRRGKPRRVVCRLASRTTAPL